MEENREEQEYREQLAAELWEDGERAEFPAEQEEQQAEPEAAPEADPWEGVPAALKQTLEALQSKVSAIDTIGNEVKQWSGRVGAIQRELQLQRNAAEQAAKTVSEAPTKQQMAEAERAHEKEMKQADLQIQMLKMANDRNISLESIKAALASDTMKLKTQKELSSLNRTAKQVAMPPTEPAGQAPPGQAYQR